MSDFEEHVVVQYSASEAAGETVRIARGKMGYMGNGDSDTLDHSGEEKIESEKASGDGLDEMIPLLSEEAAPPSAAASDVGPSEVKDDTVHETKQELSFAEYTRIQLEQAEIDSSPEHPPDLLEPRLSEEFRAKFKPAALRAADKTWQDYLGWKEDKIGEGAIELKEREALYNAICDIMPDYYAGGFERMLNDRYVKPGPVEGSHLVLQLTDTALLNNIKIFLQMRIRSSEIHECNDCHKCEVCTAPAIGKHYNSYVCESCRTFFKKMALAKYLVPMLTCVTGEEKCYGEGEEPIKNDCEKCRYYKCVFIANMNETMVVPEEDDEFTIIIPEATDDKMNEEFLRTVYESCLASGGVSEGIAIPEIADSNPDVQPYDPMTEFSDASLSRISDFAAGILNFNDIDIENQSIVLALSCLEIMIIRCAVQSNLQQIKWKDSPSEGDVGYGLYRASSVVYSQVIEMAKFIEDIKLSTNAIALLQAVCLFSRERKGVPTALMDRISPILQGHGITGRRALYDSIVDASGGLETEAKVEFTDLMERLTKLQETCWEQRNLEIFNFANYSHA